MHLKRLKSFLPSYIAISILNLHTVYFHIIPWLRRESKLACRCSYLKDLMVDFNIPFEVTDDEHSTLSPLSSIKNEELPNFTDGHDIYSSENRHKRRVAI